MGRFWSRCRRQLSQVLFQEIEIDRLRNELGSAIFGGSTAAFRSLKLRHQNDPKIGDSLLYFTQEH